MTDVPILPAATTVCLRDGERGLEVLLVRRTSKLVFYGGAWVFPGGRVDKEDASVIDAGSGTDRARYQQGPARRAAVREAHEEAAIVLQPDVLVPLSHWTTPPGRPRRFATWFFVAHAPGGDVSIDEGEIEQHRWSTPADALAARAAGEIELPPPTFVTLDWARQFTSVADALADAHAGTLTRYVPRPVLRQDGVISLYEGDAGYETQDADVDGPRHRLWMKRSGWRYER